MSKGLEELVALGLDRQELLGSLERSSADLDAGRVVENDQVIAWLKTWAPHTKHHIRGSNERI